MWTELIDRRRFLNVCGTCTISALARRATALQIDAGFDGLLAAIPTAMESESVPGLQIALLRNGSTALYRSFGVTNTETHDPVTKDTVFEAASLSKPVFAYLVMKLAEDGVVDLDAPLYTIEKPPVDGPAELIEAINAKMILSHTTGFPNWNNANLPLTLKRSQGCQFSYSGMAYCYLQKVIEKLTESTLDVLLQDRIFTPFAMSSASMITRGDYKQRQAYGHGKNGKPFRFGVRLANAASSLVCNAEDYARFAAALLKPPAPDKTRLKAESIAQMFEPRILVAPDVQWGLGVGLDLPEGQPFSIFQWGNNNDANNSFVLGCPATGDGAIVMTNSGTGLRACHELIPMALPGDHPVLRWRKIFGT